MRFTILRREGSFLRRREGITFFVTASWDDVCVDDYDCVVVLGGRSPELLVMNEKVVALVKNFAEKDKVFAAVGQAKLLLVATGVLKRCASGKGMKVMVKVAGGEAVESKGCVSDRKLVTAASVSDLPAFLSDLEIALGISVMLALFVFVVILNIQMLRLDATSRYCI